MPRITASVSDAQYNAVEEASDEIDESMAEVIRLLIDALRRGDVKTDALVQQGSHHDVLHELMHEMSDAPERIRELERRVNELEEIVEDLTDDEVQEPIDPADPDRPEPQPEPRPEQPPTRDRDDQHDNGNETEAVSEVSETVSEILGDWPGRRAHRRAERRRAGEAALEYLREYGDASAKELREFVEPDHPVTGQSPSTWWENTARPAVQEAVNAGVVEYVEGPQIYRWIGDDI